MKNASILSSTKIASPLGSLTLLASEKGLAGIYMEPHAHFDSSSHEIENTSSPVLENAKRQLAEYFSGHRTDFDLPLDPAGTEFQKLVWQALNTIPYGETRSYAEIAEQIGNPKAVRAVGLANGRNPLSIIVPCHRVIGKNGDLTGYGGGLEHKKFLLELEKKATSEA